MPDRRPTWQLVLESATELDAAAETPFKLERLVELVQRKDRTRGRTTISPTAQTFGLVAKSVHQSLCRARKTLKRAAGAAV